MKISSVIRLDAYFVFGCVAIIFNNKKYVIIRTKNYKQNVILILQERHV